MKVWETERLVIREAAAVTARELADFHRRNREFMKVYAPAREDAYYTEAFWQEELRQQLAEEAEDRSHRVYLYRKASRRRCAAMWPCPTSFGGRFSPASWAIRWTNARWIRAI